MKIAETVCFIFLLTGLCRMQQNCNSTHLNDLMNAILRSLQYADFEKTKLNLDGMMGVRMASDQLKLLSMIMSLRHFALKDQVMERLNYLKDMSNNIATLGITYLKATDPDYFQTLGSLLEPGTWGLRYFQERKLNRSLVRKPMFCNESTWVEDNSDKCLSEIIGTNKETTHHAPCHLSEECVESMLDHGNKDYALTHQILYLQLAEMKGCVGSIEKYGFTDTEVLARQEMYCANVLRDAEEITRYNYPDTHRDLLLEQIGLCGMYGFSDFWRDDWTYQMMDWQENNGCFIHTERWKCQDQLTDGKRVKRRDNILDGGCSSHMTGVALLALTTNLRFCLIDKLRGNNH